MVRGSYYCYLLGSDLVLVKEGRGREEKNVEVDIMVPTCSTLLLLLPSFGFTNTFFPPITHYECLVMDFYLNKTFFL